MIPVYKPFLPKGALKQAHDALDSSWLSSSGKYLQIATEKLQELLQVPYVLLTNNGTTACHLMAKSLLRINPPSGFDGFNRKKKIIVPNNVYVAAWNAFLFDKEYILIPVDTDLNTWNFDLHQLDEMIKKYPDADVLIVHNIGNIINVPELRRKYVNTYFVEDNCEGFLGKYEGRPTGTAAVAAAISFFGNKNITSGEGGAFITASEDLYQYATCIHGQGQSSERFIHKELGYNYRMSNVQAAILCGQIEILPNIISMKHEIFENYRMAFGNREDILIQTIPNGTKNANWMFGIRIPAQQLYGSAEIYFKKHGIEIRPMFYSINTHRHLKNNIDIICGNNINADILNKKSFILPSYPGLTKEEQKYIIDEVNNYVRAIK